MSDLSIPTALNPQGTHVPIDEAEKRLNYYRCPECKEFVTARIGPHLQYFAHKRGVLEDKTCPLSSDADVEEMVDRLRKSDIEREEERRSIRVYLGERHEGQIECFGVIPSLEWDQIPQTATAEALLDQVKITAEGATKSPVPENFHPSESETVIPLDPEADRFEVNIEGPIELDAVTGVWTAEGLSTDDLFVGDQRRARRHNGNRQIKEGEWIYSLSLIKPRGLPELVTTYEIGPFSVLAFPAREETEKLLEDYGEGISTDDYGFDANLMLPPDTHPTVEAPTYGFPGERVLVGVVPADEIDPSFEVVSIPKDEDEVTKLEPTGAGNPRYYSTMIPRDGSKRISIHQRGSERHRMIHLHPVDSDNRLPEQRERNVGLRIIDDDSTLVSALGANSSYKFTSDLDPYTLPTRIEYLGPEGLDIELTGQFIEQASVGPRLFRVTSDIDELITTISDWVVQGCKSARIGFSGVGRIELTFPQPALATRLDRSTNCSTSGQQP